MSPHFKNIIHHFFKSFLLVSFVIGFSSSRGFSVELNHEKTTLGLAKIKVLKAPLFTKPYQKSKVIQYLEKGDEVIIHGLDIPNKIDYEQYSTKNKYVRCITVAGEPCFIKSSHILFLTSDTREIDQIQNFYAARKAGDWHDETDNRPNYPLVESYPFETSWTESLRKYFSLGYGTQALEEYPHTDLTLNTNRRPVYSFLMEAHGADVSRFNYSLSFRFANTQNDVNLIDRTSRERWTSFGVGPLISWKISEGFSEEFRIQIRPILLIDLIDIVQTDFSGAEEQNSYLNITPALSFAPTYIFNRKKNVSLFLAGEANLRFPSKANATSDSPGTTWWQGESDDFISLRFQSDFNAVLGIRVLN